LNDERITHHHITTL